jgi:hypothetical protein
MPDFESQSCGARQQSGPLQEIAKTFLKLGNVTEGDTLPWISRIDEASSSATFTPGYALAGDQPARAVICRFNCGQCQGPVSMLISQGVNMINSFMEEPEECALPVAEDLQSWLKSDNHRTTYLVPIESRFGADESEAVTNFDQLRQKFEDILSFMDTDERSEDNL